MNDITQDTGAAQAAPIDQRDPLAAFKPSAKEKEGVSVDVEHPETGEVLMRFRVARFGGSNNAKIIRVERELKGRMTQKQRRQLDNGTADPDLVMRLNRMTFVRTTILGFEPVHPALKERYPSKDGPEAHPVVDELFRDYPGMYDAVSELATDEAKYATDETADAKND